MLSDTAQSVCWTWRDRLYQRFFPAPNWPRRESDSRTFLSTDVRVNVDWGDRLKLLLTGRVHVRVTTYTDVLVNDAESLSVFAVVSR